MQQTLATIYIFVICYIYPLIYHYQYYDLGTTKVRWFVYIQVLFLFLNVLLGCFHLFQKKKYKKVRSKNRKQNRAMYICLLCFILSYSLSKYKAYSFWGAPGWGQGLIPVLLMFWSFYFLSKHYVVNEHTCELIGFSVFFPALIGFLNICKIDIIGMHSELEIYEKFSMLSTIGNPTWYVVYVCMFLPLVIQGFLSTKKWYRLLWGCNLFCSIGSVLFAGTITGLVSLVFLFIMYLYIWIEKKCVDNKHLLRLFFALGIGVVLVLFVLYFISTFEDSWGNGRGFIWKITWAIYKELPFKGKIWGVGPDCFAMALQEYAMVHTDIVEKLKMAYKNALLTNAHNIYLNGLITTGILGIISYVIFWGTNIIESIWGYKNRFHKEKYFGINRMRISFLMGILVFFFAGVTGYDQPCGTPYLYIFGGLMAACDSVNQ